MVILVACFALQTYLVYSDPPVSPPLDEYALEGRRVWHQHNCQSCHQLYGFGGFLGPDLTNAIQRISPERIETVLLEGSGSMPAFAVTEDDIFNLQMFLLAMDESGQGTARFEVPEWGSYGADPELLTRFETAVYTSKVPHAQAGYLLFQERNCVACHFLFFEAPTGADLTKSADRLSRPEILEILEKGNPPRMPAPELTAAERETLASFVEWLSSQRRELLGDEPPPEPKRVTWSEVPWWEFR